MKRALIIGCLVAWAVLNLLPLVAHPQNGPMPLVDQSSDFFNTHLPTARYIHDSLVQSGRLPLWNAAILSGQPLAADPLAGYWYLPNWLTYWQPQTWMFTLLFLLHLVWTGLGMMALLKSEGTSTPGALLAAVAWMGTPRLIGYIGSGQVTIVYALAWTPWLLLAFRRAAQDPGPRKVALAAACLAVTFLADVRWGFLGGIFAVAYGLAHFHFSQASLRRAIPWGLAGGLLGAVLTAGLSLPMLEFMGLSRRAALTRTDAGAFGIQPLGLLGLLIPPYGMIYELVVYLGWLPLLLAVLGAIRRKWFWLGAILVAALYALGNDAFLFPLLLKILPGASWLRVPSRAWFIVSLAAAALAGWGLDGLLASLQAAKVRPWAPALLAGLLIVLTGGNLLWYNASQLKSAPVVTSAAADWLETQPGLFRVYSPDGSLPPLARLQQANGINPLHLASYASFLGKAAGMDLPGYSVSVPNIYLDASTPPEIIAAASKPDTALLGQLNVKYLVSSFPLNSAGLKLVQQFGAVQVYQNLGFRPRAWLDGGQVTNLRWSPDWIELASDGPAGNLVLSQVTYPGWQAEVDGAAVPIVPSDGLLQSVSLPAGHHSLDVEFRPLSVYLGTGIAGIGWLGLGGLLVAGFFSKRKAPGHG